MSTFDADLARLCGQELRAARFDPERAGAMLQTLVASLALTIAVISKGDSGVMNKMLEGTSSYLFDEATQKAKIGKLLGDA